MRYLAVRDKDLMLKDLFFHPFCAIFDIHKRVGAMQNDEN